MKSKKQEYEELSFLYFRFRNLFNSGFQRYAFYKNLIGYICNISDYQLIRRIFEALQARNIFDEKKQNNKIYYLFNPYNETVNQTPDITVDWT